MAALLVSLSIAAIMMTAVMPVWKQMARREKEEELIFRGQQYSRALRLFATKYANASPPNLDVLVEQRFIRKKFKDPITNDDFQPILAGQALPGNSTTPQQNQNQGRGGGPAASSSAGTPGAGGARGGSSPFATGSSNPFGGMGINQPAAAQPGTAGRGISPIGTPGAGATGGVIGVVSKSKDTSIRLYNGRNHYNEWTFVNTVQVQAPGVGGARGAGPGRGGPGGVGPGGTSPSPFGTSPFGGRGSGRGTNSPNPGGPPTGPGRGNPTTSPFGPARPIQPPPTRPR